MILKPVLTEKSLSDAKNGKYTFWVDVAMAKPRIKSIIHKTFGVSVKEIRTIKVKGEIKKNSKGFKKIIMSRKKAIVSLGEKEKIDLFEVKE